MGTEAQRYNSIALVFLPRKFQRQRSLRGNSPQGHKEWDTTEHTHTHTSHLKSRRALTQTLGGMINTSLASSAVNSTGRMHHSETLLTSIKLRKMKNKKSTMEKVLTVSVKQCGTQKSKTSTIIPASLYQGLFTLIPLLECGVEINENPSSKFFFFFF